MKTFDQYYECRACTHGVEEYSDLIFYNHTDGGFCPLCGGDDIKTMTCYKVFQILHAENQEDAIQTALELEDWEASEIIFEEISDGSK